MLFFTILLFSVFITSASRLIVSERFEQWCDDFQFKFTESEHSYKVLEKWVSNDEFIHKFNLQNHTFTLGHNQFSGMDLDDFRLFLSTERSIREKKYIEVDAGVSLPTEVNWVKAGAVTPVKDQGQCGSCWSFSTTGALEGAYFNKYKILTSFSEQQLVDCDNLKNGGKNHGCNGGLMDSAFEWISKNNGLCTEAAYPYVSGVTGASGVCTKTCPLVFASKIGSYVDVKPNSDVDMMNALYKQPVSIAIEADQREFQLYKSGVFTAACGANLDHGVLAVGYGTMSGLDYYMVKNSWSTTWGDGGYIYLGRGVDPATKQPYNGGAGQCGILMEGSYPVMLV